MKFSARSGMTLVEVLAVVVILGLLASTLVVGFSGSFRTAKHELAKTEIAQILKKIEMYNLEKGSWPPVEQGLRALTLGAALPTDSFFVEPDQLTDPWQNPYYLIIPGPDGRPYEVFSYGADGQAGGEGENRDISSTSLKGKGDA